jgi:hypothetical protein
MVSEEYYQAGCINRAIDVSILRLMMKGLSSLRKFARLVPSFAVPAPKDAESLANVNHVKGDTIL